MNMSDLRTEIEFFQSYITQQNPQTAAIPGFFETWLYFC